MILIFVSATQDPEEPRNLLRQYYLSLGVAKLGMIPYVIE